MVACIASIGNTQEIRTGSFIANDPTVYPISGSVEYIQAEDSSLTVEFKNDFATVQGSRLEVFLSTDASFDNDDLMISEGPIGNGVGFGLALTGPQDFTIPDGVEFSQYDYVLVQCTSFNVLWGHAEFSGGSGGNQDGGGNNNGGSNNTWTIIDVDEGEKPTLTLDNNGQVHIAFMDETNPGFVKIAELNGDQFESTLVDEGSFYGPLDLAFTPTNRARIAYHDHNEADGEYALAKQMANGSYTIDYIYSSGHDGWDNTIFIESDGSEHYLSTASNVEYAYEENGEYIVEDIGIGTTTYKWATDIQVVDDIVYAVAYEASSGDLILGRRENGTWSTEVITVQGRFPSLSIDDTGDIMVAYFKKINNFSGYVELAHRGAVGWEYSIIDTLNSYDEGNARNVVKLHRNPWATSIAYTDSNVFNLATLSVGSNEWNIENVIDVTSSGTTLRNQSSMDIDDQGFYHFATYRAEAGAAGGGMIMYITNKEIESGGIMEAQTVTKNIQFNVNDSQGNALPEAEVVISSVDGSTEIMQMNNSQFAVAALESSEDQIRVCVSLNTPAIDNLSSVDVVRAQRIVLGLVDPCPANLIAADVDESNSVSSVDLVQMINVIIGRADKFTNNPSWVFMINDEVKTCETLNLSTLPSSLDITGIKKGNLECVDPALNFRTEESPINWKH